MVRVKDPRVVVKKGKRTIIFFIFVDFSKFLPTLGGGGTVVVGRGGSFKSSIEMLL